MKVLTVFGTRSEVIKLGPIARVLDQHCDHTILHTGEVCDDSLTGAVFNSLDLRSPDIDLTSSGPAETGDAVRERIAPLIRELRPDRILAGGGLTTTAAVGVSASENGVPAFFLDPLRFVAADVAGVTQLLRNNEMSPDRTYSSVVVGGAMREVLESYEDRTEESTVLSGLGIKPFDFFLATVHHSEDLERDSLTQIITSLSEVAAKFSKTVLLPTHPRTAAKLKEFNISVDDTVRLLRPLSFFEFVKLERSSLAVITDSRAVQEECCIQKVPVVTIGNSAPLPETVECGANMFGGVETDSILLAVELSIAQPASWDIPANLNRPNISQIVTKIVLGSLS